MHRLTFVIVLAAGCVPTSYAFSPTTKGEVPRAPGPNGCEFAVLQAAPEEGFEEVGIFKHYNGDVPTQEAEFKKALGSRVCDVGGHAVIANRDAQGRYLGAQVIKYSRGFHL